MAAVCHGLEAVGPKYGVTARHILRAAGVDVDLSPKDAAARLADPALGWTYVDQAKFCPKPHDLIPPRTKIIKRQAVTTIETQAQPIRGRNKTHLVTGYVHKPYPPIYAMLARHAGFDSALLIRGVEGGVIPSPRQPGKASRYEHHGEEYEIDFDPAALGIEQTARAASLAAAADQVRAALDSGRAARRVK